MRLKAEAEHRASDMRGSLPVLWVIGLVALSGCGNIQPWVKPYERAAFADPIMAADPNPISSSYTAHVREVREGAHGASGVAGGGCGCN